MISGAHTILYAKDPERARAFFKDVLGLPSVDAGRGWLIFALPPAEIAAHPAEEPAASGHCELYLMCDDLAATMKELAQRGAVFTAPISEQRWGLLTRLSVPGAGEVGLYQPKHPLPPRSAGGRAAS